MKIMILRLNFSIFGWKLLIPTQSPTGVSVALQWFERILWPLPCFFFLGYVADDWLDSLIPAVNFIDKTFYAPVAPLDAHSDFRATVGQRA